MVDSDLNRSFRRCLADSVRNETTIANWPNVHTRSERLLRVITIKSREMSQLFNRTRTEQGAHLNIDRAVSAQGRSHGGNWANKPASRHTTLNLWKIFQVQYRF